MGVVWSTLPIKDTRRPIPQEPSMLAHLFDLWDTNGDQNLSVVEICTGLRRQTDASLLKLPLLMFARTVHCFQAVMADQLNPEWQMYDFKEFQEMVYTATVEELEDDTQFIQTYGNVAYLEKILPQQATEQANATHKKTQKKKKKKKKKTKRRKTKETTATAAAEYDGENVTTRMQKIFQEWDENNDEVLSVEEMKVALERNKGRTEPPILEEVERNNVVEYIHSLEVCGEHLEWHSLDGQEFENLCSKHLME